MKLLRKRSLGFSMVEIVITLSVLSILVAVALPSMREFVMNAEIRNTADSYKSGLQLARAEAIQRNKSITFKLLGVAGWEVGCVTPISDTNNDGIQDCPSQIQVRDSTESGQDNQNIVITTNPVGATTVTFNGLGRIISNTDGSASISFLNVNHSNNTGSSTRQLRVRLVGSSVSTCDPNAPTGAPTAC